LFKHAWERKERDLAVQWGVKGSTKLVKQPRAVEGGGGGEPMRFQGKKWDNFQCTVALVLTDRVGGNVCYGAPSLFRSALAGG
jgi:hypothetical protein